MSDFRVRQKEMQGFIDNKMKSSADKTITHLRLHYVDYILVFCICIVLGVFDIFVIKKSDNLFQPSYWYHAFCRLMAFILAGVLGVRIGYPKALDNSLPLKTALSRNEVLKQLRQADFSGFIEKVNNEVKISAWKNKINKQRTLLEKKAKFGYNKYFEDGEVNHLKKYKDKEPSKRAIRKADEYVIKRKMLEIKLSDEYINENLNFLDVKFPLVHEHDFDYTVDNEFEYVSYKTRKTVKKATAGVISKMALSTVVLVLLIGCIAFDIDKALAYNKVVAIVSIIINGIIDIGLVLWKFASAYNSCDKIVEQEDLRVTVDKNTLLEKYCNEKNIDISNLSVDSDKDL